MYYVTVREPPKHHQMTLEEFLFQENPQIRPPLMNETNTHTYEFKYIGWKFRNRVDVPKMIQMLEMFNENTASLRDAPRASLYREFSIPKQTGGLRRISAPKDDLMLALRELKAIFEHGFGILYHTSAFAYVKGRSTVGALKRHQQNESRWFAKFDMKDFFGSTTQEFVMDMFSRIYPFALVVESERGRTALETALSLCFLKGGLPQGTPISPLLTNIMMIPIDFRMTQVFRDFDGKNFVYTRYADDFALSCRFDFNLAKVEEKIGEVLREFHAPFSIKKEKTHYGSNSGANWMLGLMLNKDNDITVGYKRRRELERMLYNYVRDKKNGTPWPLEDIQTMEGKRSYYSMVEGARFDEKVNELGKKLGVDIIAMIRADLRVA